MNHHHHSLTLLNLNNHGNQRFSLSYKEKQHMIQLHIDKSETILGCFKCRSKPCYCDMQISFSHRYWDMEGRNIPLSLGVISWFKGVNEYMSGLAFVSVRFETTD